MSTKRKASARFAPPTTKSAIKVPTKATIDESRTAVSATDSIQTVLKSSQNDAIEISSDEPSESEADSDDEMNGVETTETTQQTPSKVNGASEAVAGEKAATAEDDNEDEDDEETSPSFGELLRGTIDVPALLAQAPDGSKSALAKPVAALAPPSLSSLGTVLAQALRTEDTELLESCLQVTNPESVQQTIERLDSALAGVLLTKLAARFHRRPGRAGSLMAWVKWTLVAHGGALAIQPKVLDRLVSLQKVLNERSRGLPSLLALKGKLDMLDAQMQLRQARQRRQTVDGEEDSEDDDEEEGAIYVEGEEVDDIPAVNGDAYDDEDATPIVNGFAADSDVDDDEDEDVDDEDDSDDVGDESLDEDEVDHNDVEESVSDDDSDAEAAPPTKVQKTARTFGKRR